MNQHLLACEKEIDAVLGPLKNYFTKKGGIPSSTYRYRLEDHSIVVPKIADVGIETDERGHKETTTFFLHVFTRHVH